LDDILVLAPSRWKLRGAIKAVNEVLQSLWLEKHPDKTSIGKIERGFDYLGYHFSRYGLRAAKATIQMFVERATRLYEQEREGRVSPSALGNYVRRWNGWLKGGLECISTLPQPLLLPPTDHAETNKTEGH
jgi:RNA-directed DNA polymerase